MRTLRQTEFKHLLRFSQVVNDRAGIWPRPAILTTLPLSHPHCSVLIKFIPSCIHFLIIHLFIHSNPSFNSENLTFITLEEYHFSPVFAETWFRKWEKEDSLSFHLWMTDTSPTLLTWTYVSSWSFWSKMILLDRFPP